MKVLFYYFIAILCFLAFPIRGTSSEYVNADGFVDYSIRVMKRLFNQLSEDEFKIPDSQIQVSSDNETYDLYLTNRNVTDISLMIRMGEVDVTQDGDIYTLAFTLRFPLLPLSYVFSAAENGEVKFNGKIDTNVEETYMLTGVTVTKETNGTYEAHVDYVRVTHYGTTSVDVESLDMSSNLSDAIADVINTEYSASVGDLIAAGIDTMFENAVTSIDPTSYFT